MEAHLLISSKRKNGHRRAGMRFEREPTAVPTADLDDAAIAALEADPDLVIQEGEGPYGDDPRTPADALKALTVTKLRAIAKERDVDLGKAKKKDEIVALLLAADEASAAPDPGTGGDTGNDGAAPAASEGGDA